MALISLTLERSSSLLILAYVLILSCLRMLACFCFFASLDPRSIWILICLWIFVRPEYL